MSMHPVIFKQKKSNDVEWDDIHGVQLMVEASGEFELFIKVRNDVDAAFEYQKEVGEEVAIEASWDAPNGNTVAYEVVSNDMFVE